MCGVRIFEEKIVLCKKGDEITGLDGNSATTETWDHQIPRVNLLPEFSCKKFRFNIYKPPG